MAISLRELFEDIPVLKVVDVGASPIEGDPIYGPLHDAGGAELVGFEPAADQFQRLLDLDLPRATFLPDAIGDGTESELRICQAPGMTSMLEPDQEVLSHFHQFSEFGKVVGREKMPTRRLDDIPETQGMDFLKVDVQGGELRVFEGARARLTEAVMVQTEVQFVPFYEEQPLFAELDQMLRGLGFWFHRFGRIRSRVFKPLLVNNDPFAGMSQQLWSDAIYVRRFVDFSTLETPRLLKLALVAHDFYRSYDLAALALRRADEQEGTQRHARYLQHLAEGL